MKRIKKLFPEDRNIEPHIAKNISSKEQAIFESTELKRAAKRLLEHIEAKTGLKSSQDLARVVKK